MGGSLPSRRELLGEDARPTDRELPFVHRQAWQVREAPILSSTEAGTYVAWRSDYAAGNHASVQDMFEDNRDELLRDNKATLTSERRLTNGGRPGIELVAENKSWTYKLRSYVVGGPPTYDNSLDQGERAARRSRVPLLIQSRRARTEECPLRRTVYQLRADIHPCRQKPKLTARDLFSSASMFPFGGGTGEQSAFSSLENERNPAWVVRT